MRHETKDGGKVFLDMADLRSRTFCGRPFSDYTHDELILLVVEAITGMPDNLGTLVAMAMHFNARRDADAMLAARGKP